MVELEDGATVPILYNVVRAQRRLQQKNVEALFGHDVDTKTPYPLIRASAKTNDPAQSQECVLINAKLHGLVVIQPGSKVVGKHELIFTSWLPKWNQIKCSGCS